MGDRRILITGGAGFVGVALTDRLLGTGAAVAIVDDFSGSDRQRLARAESAGVAVHVVDITTAPQLTRVIELFRPTHCVHLAAIHFIPRCLAEPAATVSTNVLGTQRLLDAIIACAPECRLLLASTGDVYRPGSSPHSESGPTEPDNVYGLSKLAAEALVRFSRLDAVIARLFNVFGPGETNPHFIPEVVGQLRSGGPLRLGNLTARRDYVYVEDVAAALVALLTTAPAGTTVNVGTGRSHSGAEVLGVLEELTGRQIEVDTDPTRLRPSDRPNLQADVTHLHSLVPGACPTSLSDGLRSLLTAEGLVGA